jgi:hypothetical protein
MRRFLLAATILLPFAVAPAFAEMQQPMTAAGDINIGKTAAGSSAGVSSQQGTMAGAKVAGNGAVIVGAVSGNYNRSRPGQAPPQDRRAHLPTPTPSRRISAAR